MSENTPNSRFDLGDLLIAWAKRRHAADFPAFAARVAPDLPAAVHLATQARPKVPENNMAIVEAAGIDRIRRDEHALLAARVRLWSWPLLIAAIAGSYYLTSYGFDHLADVRAVYQAGLLAPEKKVPVTPAEKAIDRAAAIKDKATGAVAGWKDRRQAKRDNVYDAARADRN